MPGIVGYCPTDPRPAASGVTLEQMVTAVRHEPWYQVVRAGGEATRCACVHLGHFDHAITKTSADGNVGVMLNGWVFGPAGDAADSCLSQYLEHGIKFSHHLNGQFNLLVWDDRERAVFLVNDRYGTRPWQYAHLADTLFFAPEAKAILAASGAPKALNTRMMVNQLSWGRIWIGDETFFEHIFMLPPGSILCWKNGKATLEQYWDYVYRPESIDDDFIDHAIGAFHHAVARQTKPRLRHGVALSGGLDSRTVLGAMSRLGVPLRAYTWGLADTHDEVAIARRVADLLSVPWQFQSLAPADFVSEAGRGVFLTEGLDLSVQSYGLKVFPALRDDIDVLVTGLILDVTMGGSYLSSRLTSPTITPALALADTLERSLCFSLDECRHLIRAKDTPTILAELRDRATSEWDGGENSDPADQCDRFILRSRMTRYIFGRQAWQRYFLEDFAPTLDNEFIDILLRVPAAWRLGHRFYQRFLQRFSPALAAITYQRTLLPPVAPIEFWSPAAQLEQQREQLYRDIWRVTQGAVFVPYRRFSTNYDEWLRSDPAWITVTDNLLLSPQSLSCEWFLDRSAVETLIQDHRSARASNHKKLIQLLTLELFLRAFFA
jgi:asparagine synthase (glutamine-hydrolysing)